MVKMPKQINVEFDTFGVPVLEYSTCTGCGAEGVVVAGIGDSKFICDACILRIVEAVAEMGRG